MEVINFESMLNSLQKLIFHLTEDNMENSVQQTLNLFDPNFPYSFNFTICKIVYSAFCKQNNEIYKFINYLKLIQTKEEEMDKSIPKIIDIFIDQIIKIKSHDAYFIIEKMIEKNLIDKNVTKNISSPYFAHYKTEDKNKIKKYFYSHYRKNFEELSRNNWELHKKYVKEGVNENEIAKIIRYDEIEKLQEISSQTNFDFNQRITPSPYERCSFINQYYVTLIEYAAFFGSVKCFKYLLMNNVNVENTGKYAVASGNEEIIHLCEQNHSSFKDAYETAIKFHQNDIFRYIFENKLQKFYDVYDDVEGRQIIQTRDLIELGWICINFSNYEILSFLLKEGMKIYNKNINLINESAQIGNIFLIKYFLIKNQLPKDILVYSAESGNIELFKYIFEQDGIDINVKNIYTFYFIFVLLILYLKLSFNNYL